MAVLASLAATAASASATELCATPDCSEVYESGEVLKGSLVEATETTFQTGIGPITCEKSSFEMQTTEEVGTPLPGELTALTFGECELSSLELSCTVSAVNLPYSVAIEGGEDGNGTLTVSDGGEGSPGANVNCGFGTCAVTAAEAPFSVTGGQAPIVKGTSIPMTISGAGCPATAEWSAEYELAQPRPMFVDASPAVLCKVAPKANGKKGALACPVGEGYTGEVTGTISAGVASFTASTGGTVSCLTGGFRGSYNAAATGQLIEQFYEEEEEEPCTSNFVGEPKVTIVVTPQNLGGSYFMYRLAGIYQGQFYLGKAPTLEMTIGVTQCKYNFVSGEGSVANGSGGSPSVVSLSGIWGRKSPMETKCPPSFLQGVLLKIVRTGGGGNVYVAREQL